MLRAQSMNIPSHVAIILDGNGRWAAQHGWPRIKGHKEGVKRVEDILESASDLGIKHLTLYAFSTENWKRPSLEVATLMALFRMYLRMFLPKLKRKGIRFHHVGSLDGLPAGIIADIKHLEAETASHEGMVFHLAVNYGSKLEITHAARQCVLDGLKADEITEEAIQQRLWTANAPDVDLLIRTSGELRISNFLLWQIAYAEIFVTDVLWPDFRKAQLKEALHVYSSRERRFGGI